MRRYKRKTKPETNYSNESSSRFTATRNAEKRVRIMFGVSGVGIDVKRLSPYEQSRDTRGGCKQSVVLAERDTLRLMRLLYVASREHDWCDEKIFHDLDAVVESKVIKMAALPEKMNA